MDLSLKCLFCGEDLKEGWVVCPACGAKVVHAIGAVSKCLFCGKDLKENWVSCPGCGKKVVDLKAAVNINTAAVSSNGKFCAVLVGDKIHVRNNESMELVHSVSRSYEGEIENSPLAGVRASINTVMGMIGGSSSSSPISLVWDKVRAVSDDGCHVVVSQDRPSNDDDDDEDDGFYDDDDDDDVEATASIFFGVLNAETRETRCFTVGNKEPSCWESLLPGADA